MKKIIVLLFIISVAFSFSSCKSQEISTEKFFDYQKNKAVYKGTWQEGEKAYGVTFNMGEEKKLVFHSPATLTGVSVYYDGGELFCKAGETTIPITAADQEVIFRLSKLFSLSEKDITEIFVKDETTVAKGKNGSAQWIVTTDGNGNPLKIEYSDERGKSTFTVDKAS